MNLKELDKLLNQLQEAEKQDLDLILFYTRKRIELSGIVFNKIKKEIKKVVK